MRVTTSVRVYVIGNAQQVLALPDLHVGIAAHALDEEHIKPVPRQLAAVLLHEAAVAEDGVHRVDVFKDHFFGSAVEVGIEGKIMLGKTAAGDAPAPHLRQWSWQTARTCESCCP